MHTWGSRKLSSTAEHTAALCISSVQTWRTDGTRALSSSAARKSAPAGPEILTVHALNSSLSERTALQEPGVQIHQQAEAREAAPDP